MLEEEFIEYREWMLKDDLEEFNKCIVVLGMYYLWSGFVIKLQILRAFPSV
ncbi:MAG: hypothetical protein N2327_04285 [Caldimicrobium sp.]|nr:hypothetical protein [Caldimicrobium sp.]MCX7873633.1 hypothetical protein [Caldimicrobium sp.]